MREAVTIQPEWQQVEIQLLLPQLTLSAANPPAGEEEPPSI
jgi:hypothetical protein